MREDLLCRAKRLDNGKWIIGQYIQTPAVSIADLAEIGDPMPDSIQDCISVLKVKRYPDRASGQMLATVVQEIHRVDPETLCRYAGVKDISGKPIFEGDFIRCTKFSGGYFTDALTKFGLVQERHSTFGIVQNFARLESWQVPYIFRPFRGWLEGYDYEILGNKFDHPTMWRRFTRTGGPVLRCD